MGSYIVPPKGGDKLITGSRRPEPLEWVDDRTKLEVRADYHYRQFVAYMVALEMMDENYCHGKLAGS